MPWSGSTWNWPAPSWTTDSTCSLTPIYLLRSSEPRMGLKQAFLCAIAIVLPSAAHAMNVEVYGDTVYASGPVENDFGKFQDTFNKPGVTKVVFVNSPGG